MISDHIQQDIFLAFQAGDCLLLNDSADSSCISFLHYFHSAISNHLSIEISMSPEWMVAKNRFNCIVIFIASVLKFQHLSLSLPVFVFPGQTYTPCLMKGKVFSPSGSNYTHELD